MDNPLRAAYTDRERFIVLVRLVLVGVNCPRF